MAGELAISILFIFSLFIYCLSLLMNRYSSHKKILLISGIIIMAIAFVIVKRVDTKYKDVANNNLVIKKMV